jgi:ABC-type proline/glycine betaine transport system ATPase subunit
MAISAILLPVSYIAHRLNRSMRLTQQKIAITRQGELSRCGNLRRIADK